MPRQRKVITTRSEPVGPAALVIATILGVAGVGFWMNLIGNWVAWNEPFANFSREWRTATLPHIEPLFAWIPATLQLLFHASWPAWGYDYIAATVLFGLGAAVGIGPDLVNSLMAPPDVEDDDQDRIIGNFVGRDVSRGNQVWRLPSQAEFKAMPGLILKGFGYVIVVLTAGPFIWPLFLISVPFAFLSLVTKWRVTHFVKMTYVLFAPAMLASIAWVANVIISAVSR